MASPNLQAPGHYNLGPGNTFGNIDWSRFQRPWETYDPHNPGGSGGSGSGSGGGVVTDPYPPGMPGSGSTPTPSTDGPLPPFYPNDIAKITPQTNVNQDARDYIYALLSDYGLGGEAGWAWEELVNGQTQDQVSQSLRKRPAYQIRFQGLAIRAQKGLSAISESEYINYERNAYQLMREAGMPPGFYDDPADFANLIGNDVSINEVNQRITNSYGRVAQAPQSVRDAFAEFYGANGDSALAAFFLDPDRAQPLLERAAAAAEVGGIGADFGFGLDKSTAEQVGGMGLSSSAIREGIATLGQGKSYFDETISERDDLRAETTGVKAAFGIDGESADAFRNRRDRRAAEFGGTEGAYATQQGVLGAGAKQR